MSNKYSFTITTFEQIENAQIRTGGLKMGELEPMCSELTDWKLDEDLLAEYGSGRHTRSFK